MLKSSFNFLSGPIFWTLALCVLGFGGRNDVIIVVKESFRNANTFSDLQKDYSVKARYQGLIHGLMPARLPAGMSWNSAVNVLESDSRVEYVEADYIMHASEMPDDPLFSTQWALYNPDGERADIKGPEAWDVQKGKKDVVLAILDTGVDYLHPDLKANIWINEGELPENSIDDDKNGFVDDVYGWDFAYDDNDPMGVNSHGTNVAGAAGAVGNNGIGVAGVIHKVRIMSLKALGDFGFGFSSDLMAGIYYAVDNGADVINASWGGGGPQKAMEAAIEYAALNNVIFVAACGNGRRDNDKHPFYPSSYTNDNIIAVGATGLDDHLAKFSQYGKISVDLFAPGVNIYTTAAGGGYMYNGGTSLAAPLVTGALGLLISSAPEVDYHSYIKVLFSAVEELPQLEDKCVTGGRLDAARMLHQRHKLFRNVKVSKVQRAVLTILSQIQKKSEGGTSP